MFDKLKNFINKNNDELIDIAPGWDAIEDEFLKIYPGQIRPKHYGVTIPWVCGGEDPLDGISIYDGGDYWHFVTFGLSELYGKETDNKDISGFGYEMTLKLKKTKDDEEEIKNICKLFQRIAKNAFTRQEIFKQYERMFISKDGIDSKLSSKIVGFICIQDPLLKVLDTVNGKLEFIEFIGVTEAEFMSMTTMGDVKELYEKLGNDITDLNRDSII